jgi:hypothetical protein
VCGGVDHLCVDAKHAPDAAHGSREGRARVQPPADRADIDVLPLEREGRGARRIARVGELGRDVEAILVRAGRCAR